jgi:glycosyltransferase involved in cell wall biosynthesis
MKILYVITGLTLGGAEKVVCTLADEMAKKGHEVKIAFLKGRVEVFPQNKEIELINLELNSTLSFLGASCKYKKLVKDFMPDVIHAHMVHANIFTRINQIYHIKVTLICSAHNSNEGGKIRMLAYRMTNFLSHLNTNVSIEATEAFIKQGAFSQKNIVTVYNGIDLNKFNNKDTVVEKKNKKVCLSVGRLNVQKDYFNLLNAITLIDKAILNDVEFHIVGEGELRGEIEQKIKELNLEDKVTLLGMRSDIPDLLNNADFFILSSKHEGLPTVLIEAMACKCFVVTTDCGGSAEIIGDTGILVPRQNHQELANGLQKAFKLNSNTIHQNNMKARARVEEKFSLEQSINQWLDLYERN